MRRLDPKEAAKQWLFALIVGVVAAAASIILCLLVGWSFDLFTQAPWLIWGFPLLGMITLALYKRWHLRLDLTTHRVIQKMRSDKRINPLLAPGILIGTCLSILGGGSVGKEAGALQMGASLGSTIGKTLKIKSIYRKNADECMEGFTAATGMAATFSALFFAPLGSCMFVLELTNFRKAISKHVIIILVACFIGAGITSIFGIGDVIDKVSIPDLAWTVVGQCMVIGVAAALIGTAFDYAIHWLHDLTWRISKNYFVWVIVGGLIFAALITGFRWDHFTGSGSNILMDALHAQFGPWDFAIKALLTLICLGFWFKGGEVMPSFCIGGLLGASCSYLTGGDPAFGAAIGIMAFFAAFSRCPFAAFLMGCEIFGWTAAPYMAIAIFVSYMFGSPVGMYGDGVDRLIRTRWGGVFTHTLRERMKDEEDTDAPVPSIVSELENTVRAVKKTLKSPVVVAPPEGAPTVDAYASVANGNNSNEKPTDATEHESASSSSTVPDSLPKTDASARAEDH